MVHYILQTHFKKLIYRLPARKLTQLAKNHFAFNSNNRSFIGLFYYNKSIVKWKIILLKKLIRDHRWGQIV